VEHELEQVELSRLRREQAKTRHDEVFGGLTPAERSIYDTKQERIFELEHRLSERDWQRPRFGSVA
jgi:hypothetical protein